MVSRLKKVYRQISSQMTLTKSFDMTNLVLALMAIAFSALTILPAVKLACAILERF